MNSDSYLVAKPIVGLSSCLMGNPVRFNGGHMRSQWVHEVLSQHVDVVTVCPEMAMGLGTPRAAMRLVRPERNAQLALMSSKGIEDFSSRAQIATDEILESLPKNLSGFILADRSPLCGIGRTKNYDAQGNLIGQSDGLFAARLRENFPNIVISESGRLMDPVQREHFTLRLFMHASAAALPANLGKMQEFQRRHKFLIYCQGVHYAKALGSLLGSCSRKNVKEVLVEYRRILGLAFAKVPKPSATADALLHLYGFLKLGLDARQRVSVRSSIEHFRENRIPVSVPLHLLQFANQVIGSSYVGEQTIFSPNPLAKMAIH